jgi:hypothetical protein
MPPMLRSSLISLILVTPIVVLAVQGPNYLYVVRGKYESRGKLDGVGKGSVSHERDETVGLGCSLCQPQETSRQPLFEWAPDSRCRSGQIREEVFLKGQFIEVGVHAAGSFGTAYVLPLTGWRSACCGVQCVVPAKRQLPS